jgi:predicted NUDIX family phosphoesterase
MDLQFKSKLDEATLRQKLDFVVQENDHVKVIPAELATSASKSINGKVEVGVGGKERSSEGESGWERDIWVTKLVVHPIKVSHPTTIIHSHPI